MAVLLTHAAQLSDLAFQGALAGYVTALACHAAEFAAHRTAAPVATHPRAAAGRQPGRAGVALLTWDGDHTAGSPAAESAAGSAEPGWGERLGRAAGLVTAIGFALNVVSLIFRGLAVHRPPWGNMYEFASLICAAAVGTWLIAVNRARVRRAGLFVMLPIAILAFLAGTVLYTPAETLVPALQSYWLVIHVLAVAISSGVLMLSGIASLMYVLRSRYDRRHAESGDDDRSPLAKLPTLDSLDRLAYRTAIVGFPLFTFAVVAGAFWAEAAWGRYWGWDPKETTALLTWILYAGYLHARATSGWRGNRAAWISILGLASIMFNLFFVNMVISGLHSYAGLN